MSDLYTYIVKYDVGLAPNPFWGWCTLAVCTPNHQGSNVKPGDWIAGFLDKSNGYKFLYAMEVTERLHMDTYFNDIRFSKKKPLIDGTPRQRCGDNFYSFDDSGKLKQHETAFHADMPNFVKDTKHPWVFVAKKFWYLGKAAQAMPEHLLSLAGGRGARVNHPPGLADEFKAWVQSNFKEGMAALPRDIKDIDCGRGGCS